MMMQLLQKTATILLLLLLTACGFHLRGSDQVLPPELHTLYIQTDKPFSPLNKELQRTLKQQGIIIAENTKQAPYTLQIISDNNAVRQPTPSSNNQLSTQQVTYSVEFTLLDRHGKQILKPQKVMVRKQYAANINNMSSSDNIQQQLNDELRSDIVRQILVRLAASDTVTAIQSLDQNHETKSRATSTTP